MTCMERWIVGAAALMAGLWPAGDGAAQALTVANPSFEDGAATPSGWALSGGEGAWRDTDGAAGKKAIVVTGNGEDTNFWRSEELGFEPSAVYRLRFRARRLGGSGGTAVGGPVFSNRDLGVVSNRWTGYSSIFMTPKTIVPAE